MDRKNTLFLTILFVICSFKTIAGIVYVDSAHFNGTQSGSSWSTAFANLQSGINTANAGDSVWVAGGTYHTDSSNMYSFRMKEGVKIFGGFKNTDSAFSQRNWLVNPTILYGHDNSVVNNNGNNLTNASWIDGFEITNGISYNGGGMFNNHSSPTINNCVFSCDTAKGSLSGRGGAIYNYNCSPIILNSIFKNNFVADNVTSDELGGGAIYNINASVNITNCRFLSNKISFHASGGAIYNDASIVNVSNCVFDSNTAKFYGGAIHSVNSSVVHINNCTFSSNSSSSGAAISNLSSSSTFVNNNNFSSNYNFGGWSTTATTTGGGAIYNWAGYLSVDSCIFSSNLSALGGAIHNTQYLSCAINHCNFQDNTGGAIYNIRSNNTTRIINSTFSKNRPYASYIQTASGIYNRETILEISNCLLFKNEEQSVIGNYESYAKIINCTIAQNNVLNNDGVIRNQSNSAARIINSIISANSSDLNNDSTSFTTSQYSLVQGISANMASHNPDGTVNPHFEDTASDKYQLKPASVCINTGNNDSIPAGLVTDLEGNTRVFDNRVDMGAYEYTTILPPLAATSNSSNCSGNDLTLVAPYAAYASYLWNTGDNNRTITVNPAASETYYVTVTNTLGSAVDTIHVTINPLPVVQLGNDTIIAPGSSLMLNAGNVGASYLWNTGSTTQTIFVTTSGVYSVKVTNDNGCIAKDSIQVDFSLSIDDISASQVNWKVYPNPAKENINIAIGDKRLLNTSVVITDMLGKILIKKVITVDVQTISLSSLSPGIYFLKGESGAAVKFQKY